MESNITSQILNNRDEGNKIKIEEKDKNELQLLLEGCKISQNMLDSKGDKNSNWGNNKKRGPPNNLQNYYPPKGWNGYGLKVLNKYENNEWLSNENIEGEWYIAYYIIKDLNICKSIIEGQFNKNYHNQIYKFNQNLNPLSSYDYPECEEGIYVFPNINLINFSDKRINFEGIDYNLIVMCRINPNKVRFVNEDSIWIISNKEIRPYRILIKKINNNPNLNEAKKIFNSSCKIISLYDEKILGIGIFCKILYKHNLYKFLLTKNHFEKEIEIEEIIIEYKNKSKTINLNSREYFQNEKLDYICIEIFDEDLIWDFYDIETDILNNSFDNNLSVYLSFYENGQSLKIYCRQIQELKNNEWIFYDIEKKEGSNWAPIFLKSNNFKLIGIHYDKNKKKKIQYGTYLKYIIDDIIKQKRGDIENKLFNFFTCRICKDIINNPINCKSCKYFFCRGCIENNNIKNCPNCHINPFNTEISIDLEKVLNHIYNNGIFLLENINYNILLHKDLFKLYKEGKILSIIIKGKNDFKNMNIEQKTDLLNKLLKLSLQQFSVLNEKI